MNSNLCKAPHTNMYCSVEGFVSPCWLTIGNCDKWSEDRSLKDIWFGEHFDRYRNKCCSLHKDFTIADAYENNIVKKYPSMIELELSNQCNFECIMCDERLSSGIRKNKGLPPMPKAYSDKFIDELEEFFPYLDEIRFNGGEPFAQKIVFDIIDKIDDMKKINVATNGSILNKRVREYIEKKNISLNISIDALTKNLYEQIRVNGDFDIVMKNFNVFKKYCDIAVMVNPMTNNWFQMKDFVDFCNENDVYLGYNTVRYPKHLSIQHMPVEMIEDVYLTLHKQVNTYPNKNHNWKRFEYLVETQIKNWMLEKWNG